MPDIDLTKTLDELEGVPFGEPTCDSHLVKTVCYLYKHKKLSDFTAEDFRIVIGQKFSLQYLIPPALQLLGKDPWVEGMHYQGDLLSCVLAVSDSYWIQHPEMVQRALGVISKACTCPIEYLREECQCYNMADFLRRHAPGSPYMECAKEL
ncbi:MAG TPA: contact-dependent growth inhibition system immunity protein [Candidatus Methylacidiphilales bacterium]|nr:contact-dependent growth inhibition system immunity protein [Candidatus Methylacidiphilales bacterium]